MGIKQAFNNQVKADADAAVCRYFYAESCHLNNNLLDVHLRSALPVVGVISLLLRAQLEYL